MDILNLLALMPAGGGEEGEGGIASMIPMVLMIGAFVLIFYFMIMRPQKKRKQEEQKLRDGLAIGDEILTIGGIYGRVVSKKEDNTLIIETGADRNQIKIASFAIQKVLTVKD